jgi:hypothetical protein
VHLDPFPLLVQPQRPKPGGGKGVGGKSGKRGITGVLDEMEASTSGSVLSRQGAVVNVWAEVYCGSVEAGRWVHVDVVNGMMDRWGEIECSHFVLHYFNEPVAFSHFVRWA